MSKRSQNLRAPDISWLKAGIIGLFALSSILFLQTTEIGLFIENKVARRLEFNLRHVAGMEPSIDPRLKIFALDDSTVAEIGARDLPLKEWADIFEALDRAGPRAIFIDRFFGEPLGLEYSAEFTRRVQDLQATVNAGAHYSSNPVYGRYPLNNLDIYDHDLEKTLKRGTVDPERELIKVLDWLLILPGSIYGPNQKIFSAFNHIGHLHYENSDYTYPAFLRFAKKKAIPHWSFYGAKDYNFDGDNLVVGGHPVPLTGGAGVLVNLSHPEVYRARAYKLKPLIVNTRANPRYRSTSVKPDDVVAILPNFHTGHTDFVETPFGTVEGGIVITAMLNSVLTGQWLYPVGGGLLFTLIFALAGFYFGVVMQTRPFSIAMATGFIITIIVGLSSFVFFDVVLPWFFPALAYALTGVSVFGEKVRVHERKSQKIKDALTGFVSPLQLQEIMKRPGSLHMEPCGRNISIMFIDIVGYSLVAERMEPGDAFSLLKRLLAIMTTEIHRFGGTVDKTLGDGILAFFGYHYDGSKTIEDHPTKAVDCAIEIQKRILEHNLLAHDQGKPVFPLRIGINTAYSYVGNLGEERIDFTLIGDGVNFAQRLESACESYHVMIGASTYDYLTKLMAEDVRITQRFIKIKHREQLVEAYEVDPLHSNPQRSKAVAAYRDMMGVKRKDTRWPVDDSKEILVKNDFCDGFVKDFAPGGIGVVMPKYLGNGVAMTIRLEDQNDLDRRLREAGLSPLVCQVRWGRPFQNKFLHGIQFLNISEKQKELLVKILREAIQNDSNSKRELKNAS